MKKIFLIFLCLLVPALAFGATTYYADPSGDGTDCTIETPCTLTYAIQTKATTAGDIVKINTGTHTLTETINSSASGTNGSEIIWEAHNGNVTIDMDSSYDCAFQITHDYIKFRGTSSYSITYTNIGTEVWGEYTVIFLDGSSGDHVTNVELSYHVIGYGSFRTTTSWGRASGIGGEYADYINIHNNTITNMGEGQCDSGQGGAIVLGQYDDGAGYCTYWTIHDNTISGNYNGIYIGDGIGNDNNSIYDNTVYDNLNLGIGADGGDGDDNLIYDNTIYDCEKGLINIWKLSSTIGTGWEIYRNLLYYTKGVSDHHAVFLEHIDSSFFYNNVIYDGGNNNDSGCGANADFKGFDVRENADSNEYYNNTIYSTASGATRAFWFWDDASNLIKNNVTYLTSSDADGGYAVYYENGEGDTDTWADNGHYNNNKANHFRVDSAAASYSTWNGLGWVDESFDENPDFKNTSNLPTAAARTNDGFMPDNDASSPLIDSGSDLSETFTDDFLEEARSTFDIGAYEFIAAGGSGGSFGTGSNSIGSGSNSIGVTE